MKIILTAQERQQLIKELQEGDQTMGKFWQLLTRVSDSGQVPSWVPWTDAITPAEFATNTGLTVLSVINPQDSTTVQLGVPDVTQIVEDKSSWNADMNFELFDNNARLVNLGTTNGIKADSSIGVISAIVPDLPGAPITTPFIVAYCFDITRTPTSNETLFSFGNATVTGAYLSVDVTSNRYIQYNYKDASANTLTKTSTTAIPLDTKLCLVALFERTKIRIFLHGGSFDTAVQISDEGSFNTGISNLLFAVNCRYMDGATTQQRTSGYYYGSIIASGITTKSFDVVRNSCLLFKVPHTSSDLSTLDNGLISLIQGPGAGSLTTPKADVLDLITGMVFTATGTQPAATTGKFHNAFGLGMTASTIYMQGTVPAIWDIYNGSYGDYTIYVRYKTGTINSAVRNIFCLNPTTTPNVNNVRLQLSAANVIQLIIDNTTVQVNSTVTLSSNTWYDIIIKKASGVHSLSVNAETPVTFTPTTRSTVGGYFGFGGHFTAATTILHAGAGHLDCLALWNRTLTSDEIIQLRKGGNGLDGMFNYITQYDGGGGPPPSVVNEYRGPQVAGTNNNNIYMCGNVATGNNATYLSFIAPKTGNLRQVQIWWKTDNAKGYSAGTGGTYTLSVRTDSAGVPSATVVSEITGISGFSLNGTTSTDYKLHTFTTIGSITKGQQYHMCIINTHASPASNWVCINGVSMRNGTRDTNRPTRKGAMDFGMKLGLKKNGGVASASQPDYATYGNTCPDVTFYVDTDLNGTSDYWFGNPYLQPWGFYDTGVLSVPLTSTRRIRQILPIASSDGFTITKVSIAMYRNGTPGAITCSIMASNGTTVLGSCTIAESLFTNRASPANNGYDAEWATGTFSSPVTLSGGTTYYLQLSCTGNQYYPCTLQDGANSYGAPSGITGHSGGWYGTSGKLEESISGGAWGTYHSGDKDLAFYFDVTVP